MAVAPAGNTLRVAPRKRELVIELVRDQNLWEIKYEGGGPTPLPLRGHYTSKRVARLAIEKFKQANG